MPTPRERPASGLDGLYLHEPFVWNDVVTDNNIGQLGWQFTTIGNASTIAGLTNATYGGIKLTTASTADGDGTVLHLLPDCLAIPGISGEGGGFAFRAKLVTTIANNNFAIGLGTSVTAADPTDGIWVKCDGGVISLELDSADHGDVSQAVASASGLTGGTTMVVDTYADFEVKWFGANGQGGPRNIELYVNGETSPSASIQSELDDNEQMEPQIKHWQDSGGAAARILDLEFYELWCWK